MVLPVAVFAATGSGVLTSLTFAAGLLGTALVLGNESATLILLLLTRVGGAVDNPAAVAAVRAHAANRPQAVATIRKFLNAMSFLIGSALGGLLFGAFSVPVAVAVVLSTFLAALAVPPTSNQSEAPVRGSR